MKKTASMNKAARKRLRSRCPPTTGSADAGAVDAPVDEPQPTATRPQARSTRKKANATRRTNRKGAVATEPEPEPLQETTPTIVPNHTGGDGSELGPGPAAGTSTPKPAPKPAPKPKKAPQVPRQGIRSSARLRGQKLPPIPGPMPAQPKKKQVKHKRASDDKDNAVELLDERTKRRDDQADVPVQVGIATAPSDDQPADLDSSDGQSVDMDSSDDQSDNPDSSRNVTDDDLEQADDDAIDENAAADPFQGTPEPPLRKRFFVQENPWGGFSIALGYVRE